MLRLLEKNIFTYFDNLFSFTENLLDHGAYIGQDRHFLTEFRMPMSASSFYLLKCSQETSILLETTSKINSYSKCAGGKRGKRNSKRCKTAFWTIELCLLRNQVLY